MLHLLVFLALFDSMWTGRRCSSLKWTRTCRTPWHWCAIRSFLPWLSCHSRGSSPTLKRWNSCVANGVLFWKRSSRVRQKCSVCGSVCVDGLMCVFMYACVCGWVCVCVCERHAEKQTKRERERENQTEQMRGREREIVMNSIKATNNETMYGD